MDRRLTLPMTEVHGLLLRAPVTGLIKWSSRRREARWFRLLRFSLHRIADRRGIDDGGSHVGRSHSPPPQ